MSDYKELLKTLRGICSVKDYEPCEYNLEAAYAIEELMTKCQQLEKERDAAVEEIYLYHYCRSCKHSDVGEEKEPCMSCNQCWAGKEKCNWEWRGVQDE